MSLQPHCRSTHLSTDEQLNTPHGCLWLCLHCLFKEGKRLAALPACPVALIAGTPLLNAGIHPAAAVFKHHSPQFSETLTICDS